MATAAQIAANRRNSQLSTGPKTPPGKSISSQNSRKHGLSGSTTAALLDSDSDRGFIEDRKAQLRPEFDPRGPEEEHLFEEMVTQSLRVGRCVDAYFALCREHGRRARTEWDADRSRRADELAARLRKDPERVAPMIAKTPQGCDLMLRRWAGLASSLERHRTWTDAQRSMALDLLGVHPELRDAETPVDPGEGDVFEARRAVVAAEVGRLESLRDSLREGDAEERALAESTIGAELTLPLQLLHRYEMAALRRERWAWRKLDAARKAREPEAAPAPRPATPAPAPTPPTVRPPIVARPTPAPAPPIAVPVVPPPTPARPSVPLNRHQRRAQAAQVRQAR
jgi:hypothetical protein